jgi:VWFA-related protein
MAPIEQRRVRGRETEMAIMKKLAIPTIILFTATGIGFAQNLTEKIDVSIVNVDVTVTSHGAPAHGLTRDDFEVFEDGKPQSITNFYAIENTRDNQSAAPTAAAPAAAIPAPTDERFRRKVLVIIDNRHMTIHNRDVALNKLEQLIKDRFDSGSYDWSIAMIGDAPHMLLPLTSDKERIHSTLAQIRSIAAGHSLRDQFQVENRIAPVVPTSNVDWIKQDSVSNDRLSTLIQQANRFASASDAVTTYDGILQVSRSFANLPGRKIILLMTGGFEDQDDPLGAGDPAASARFNGGLAQLRSWLIREANASDVSISVINTEGLTPNNTGVDNVEGPSSTSSGSFYWIARDTGGQSFNGNYVDKSLHDFDVASSNFYSLAYRPNHPEDGKYYKITVHLKKPGRFTLSYRNGYSSLPIEEQIDRAMQSTMAADMQPSSISLNVITGTVKPDVIPGAILVPLTAAVAAKDLQFVPTAQDSTARVDIFVSVFNDRGGLVRTFRSVQEAHAQKGTESDGNFVLTHALRLRKGTPYRLVVALHDQVSDAIGIKSETVRF